MMTPHFLTSPELQSENIIHGFFTREGGVSDGIYASLNCGPGSQDAKASVEENRARVASSFGVEAGALKTLYQIHSPNVHVITEDGALAGIEADAWVTNKPNIMIGILTADCAPVLFMDESQQVIGAAHAGWKGAFYGVLEATIEAMLQLGATKETIKAVVGPTIAAASYEVGEDFYTRFLEQSEQNKIFFASSNQKDHYFFNLPEYVTSRLHSHGVSAVTSLNRDTYAEENLFFSYRRSCHRNEKDYGRQLSAIMIKD